MKSIIFVFAVICIVGVFSHDHDNTATPEQLEECITESGVDRQALDDMHHNRNFKVTRELDCFGACLFRKQGILDIDGNITMDNPTNNADIKKCSELRGKDLCETAGKVIGCLGSKHLIPMFRK